MTTDLSHIPFALPFIEEDEVEAAANAIRSGWLTTGPKTKEFESLFAEYVGAKHALAVNSATAGLHLALEAVGIGKDDLVILPTWTFTATAEVVRYFGAHPVLVDVDKDTLNINLEKLVQTIENIKSSNQAERLKAIIPVHFAGQACNMKAIMEIASIHNLFVIEDAAHAFPTTLISPSVQDKKESSRFIGTVGHATVFSFYATKTIATGEGGMVTTQDDALASRIKLMRLHGINRDVWDRYTSKKPSWYYEVIAPGFKYNLTDIASAIGICQLKKAERLRQKRADIAKEYNKRLSKLSLVELPKVLDENLKHAWHLYVLKLNLNQLTISRNEFIEEMAHAGVGCSVHFIPLHKHPYWQTRDREFELNLDTANNEFERCVSLPIYPSLDKSKVEKIISSIEKITEKYKR